MRMTRPPSVKYTSALVRVLPDLAPTCVKTTAGKGQTEETRPRVSRMRVGSTREAMSRPKRVPSAERNTRLTIRWATERPGDTAGTDMDCSLLWSTLAFVVSSLASRAGPRRSRSGHRSARAGPTHVSCSAAWVHVVSVSRDADQILDTGTGSRRLVATAAPVMQSC